MKKGFLNQDSLTITGVLSGKIPEDFVEVKINSKDGYKWSAEGSAGFVVIMKGNNSEVDMVAEGENIVKLLATALIKVHQIVGSGVVREAIKKYEENV